jgi:hypothetical protein
MAKGHMRSNKEEKKPKAAQNLKTKGGPPPSPFATGQVQGRSGRCHIRGDGPHDSAR